MWVFSTCMLRGERAGMQARVIRGSLEVLKSPRASQQVFLYNRPSSVQPQAICYLFSNHSIHPHFILNPFSVRLPSIVHIQHVSTFFIHALHIPNSFIHPIHPLSIGYCTNIVFPFLWFVLCSVGRSVWRRQGFQWMFWFGTSHGGGLLMDPGC